MHTCLDCYVPNNALNPHNLCTHTSNTDLAAGRLSTWCGVKASVDSHVRVVAAADDGELLMLERLSSLLRTDMAHAQQQVQQELAGMPA